MLTIIFVCADGARHHINSENVNFFGIVKERLKNAENADVLEIALPHVVSEDLHAIVQWTMRHMGESANTEEDLDDLKASITTWDKQFFNAKDYDRLMGLYHASRFMQIHRLEVTLAEIIKSIDEQA